MNSRNDFESKEPLSTQAMLLGLVVGILVFSLAVLLTGAAANLVDYSDPTVGMETPDSTPVASTPQSEAGPVQPQPSPAVASATELETMVHPKHDARTKAHSVPAAMKR